MNERFKYRVWSNRQKKWIHGPGEEINLFGEMIVFGEYLNGIEGLDELNDLVVFQCTGAKDKNGKEVFEGDIIRYKRCWSKPVVNAKGQIDYEFHDPGEWEIGYVLWLWESYRFGIGYRRYDDYDDFSGIDHRTEVIGNVKDNPELIPWYEN